MAGQAPLWQGEGAPPSHAPSLSRLNSQNGASTSASQPLRSVRRRGKKQPKVLKEQGFQEGFGRMRCLVEHCGPSVYAGILEPT